MANEGLACTRTYTAILGCILKNHDLLSDMDRPLTAEDFNTDSFHELLFSVIYNLYQNNCVVIDELAINAQLSKLPKQYDIFINNKGIDFIKTAKSISELENYDYYYHRLRKFSLLRYYENKGLDTRSIYNTTLTEEKAKEAEQAKFDKMTEQDILDKIELHLVVTPKMNFCTNTLTEDSRAGEGLDELVQEFMKAPDVGIPLSSIGLNAVSRGARLKKFYMRSGAQGGGKSRLAAGDACSFSIPWFYDNNLKKWIYTGFSEPSLYITTEMEINDIKTLVQSYVSGVNEDHIINGKYEKGEYERVMQANKYIDSSPLFISYIADFSIEDICNIIKRYNKQHGVRYICFDYIHTSMRLITEISQTTKGARLREDQLLLMFSDKLKNLCNQLNCFILTATQLSGDFINAPVKDQSLLRGAKSLADKIDLGCIVLEPSLIELEKVKHITQTIASCPTPNMCTWVYKCRRGKLVRVILWQHVDLGTCRTRDLFVTNNKFELIDVDFQRMENVETVIEEHSIPIESVELELELASNVEGASNEEDSFLPKYDLGW